MDPILNPPIRPQQNETAHVERAKKLDVYTMLSPLPKSNQVNVLPKTCKRRVTVLSKEISQSALVTR